MQLQPLGSRGAQLLIEVSAGRRACVRAYSRYSSVLTCAAPQLLVPFRAQVSAADVSLSVDAILGLVQLKLNESLYDSVSSEARLRCCASVCVMV